MKSLGDNKISFLEKIFLILVFLQTGTALTIDFSFFGLFNYYNLYSNDHL